MFQAECTGSRPSSSCTLTDVLSSCPKEYLCIFERMVAMATTDHPATQAAHGKDPHPPKWPRPLKLSQPLHHHRRSRKSLWLSRLNQNQAQLRNGSTRMTSTSNIFATEWRPLYDVVETPSGRRCDGRIPTHGLDVEKKSLKSISSHNSKPV